MIKPISEYLHDSITRRLKNHNIKTILDVGGKGKMHNRGFNIIDANKPNFDGRNLPFQDKSFDATISIATLEHVGNLIDQINFLREAIRVAKYISIHWFPINQNAEHFLISIGHNHRCFVPDYKSIMQILNINYKVIEVNKVREHFLLLATMYPRLNTSKLYDYIDIHGEETFSIILEILK